MKKIRWKSLITTCIVTLIPMLIGIIFYNQLPKNIPVHFNINNQPDNYASKEFALFGIPSILVLFQIVCCVGCDLKRREGEEMSKFESSARWWIPIISILVGVLLVEYPLRVRLDIRMYLCMVVGVLAIITGYYFPTMNYESSKGKLNPYPKDEKTFNLFVKVIGYTFMLFGVAIIVSIKFTPIISVIVIAVWVIVIILESLFAKFRKPKEDK